MTELQIVASLLVLVGIVAVIVRRYAKARRDPKDGEAMRLESKRLVLAGVAVGVVAVGLVFLTQR